MKTVGVLSSILKGLFLFAAFSSSAFGEDAANTIPNDLEKFKLSDEEIALKCAVSIKIKANLVNVQDADGSTRQITKCQQVYEAQRDAANRYVARVDQARTEILATVGDCGAQAGKKNIQENCVKASATMVQTAVASHESLAEVADEENSRMAALAPSPNTQLSPNYTGTTP